MPRQRRCGRNWRSAYRNGRLRGINRLVKLTSQEMQYKGIRPGKCLSTSDLLHLSIGETPLIRGFSVNAHFDKRAANCHLSVLPPLYISNPRYPFSDIGDRMDKCAKPELKKTYSSPELTVYGTIQDLTKQVGIKGTQDGPVPILRTAI
jgi:hypothetical protein